MRVKMLFFWARNVMLLETTGSPLLLLGTQKSKFWRCINGCPTPSSTTTQSLTQSFVKLKFNGFVKNSNLAAAGFTIRDENGHLLVAGLKAVNVHGRILQTRGCINGRNETPWLAATLMRNIRHHNFALANFGHRSQKTEYGLECCLQRLKLPSA
ncbi:hypothetical protein M0R45_000765 [Rubus argutus]|uniref:Uncharacterized protein n=1 Tax=Rubus argutus TaxID=59490 RepID=A0AAW1VJU7_RUBAR